MRYLLLAFLVILAAAGPARAQKPADPGTTEARLRELQRQIAADEARLAQTRQAETSSLESLEALERQIALRHELVARYEAHMQALEASSDSLSQTLGSLELELADLRAQYQKHAAQAYKRGRLHDWALILAARSINEMMVRVRYLSRFADQRKDRLQAMAQAARELEARQAELATAREKTRALLDEAAAEQQRLSSLQGERRQVIADLRSQRSTIQKQLDQRRGAARQLTARMQQLAAAENSKTRAREAQNPAAAAERSQLGGAFAQNQGRLPWPANGVVVEPFGDLVNPIHGTTTPNPGILIATRPSDEVRAVFAGEVLSISVIPDFGTYVVIGHGDYKSVYSNFSMIYLAEGDRVEAGQVLGRAGTDAEPKGSGLFFALFKGSTAVDPQTWLAPR